MNEHNINEILKFLKTYKTRKEIEEKFNLTNTKSYHLISWLKKANLIEEIRIKVAGKKNRVWFYKTKEEKDSYF